MNRNTLLMIAGLGAAYFFLVNRTPVFVKQTDGTYSPVGMLDRLTVALTGAQPPNPQNVSLNVPGLFNVSYTS